MRLYLYLRPDKQYAASFMSDIDIHIKELEFLKNIILKHGTRTEIKKNSFFIQRGHFCHEIAYIVRGSFKFLRHDAKGAEHIMAFAFEKEIISSYLPSRKGCDALLDVKALEDSVVIQAPLETFRSFLQISVDGEIYVRAFVESLAFDFLKKIISLHCDTPEERYLQLQKRVPDILNRVNLKEIASYLRITPETLSRIRTRILNESRKNLD